MGRPMCNDYKLLLSTGAVATAAGSSTKTCDGSISGEVGVGGNQLSVKQQNRHH